MRFKIDRASLIVGSKFTVFALFYFVFEGNFPSTSPRGAYIWRGDLTEGFLGYRIGGLIFGGAYTWRGLFSEFYGISLGKYQTYWRGVSLMKDPLDLTIHQQLLWELKPRTVIEFGAYKGGSALWLADMLKMYGCQSRIISTDIDLSLLDAEAKKSKDVEFIQGDSSNIEQFFPEEFLKVR